MQIDPLSNGVMWSIAVNVVSYILVSLMRAPEPIERLQAHLFIQEDRPRPQLAPGFRLLRTSITVGDLIKTASRYLGAERAERSFADLAVTRSCH